MIKKCGLFLLVVSMLFASVPAHATANSIETLPVDIVGLKVANEVLFTRDSIFLHTREGKLLRWQAGQQDFELFSDDIPTIPDDYPYPIDVGSMDADEREHFSHLVLRMFSDGEQLYGLNQMVGTWAKIDQNGKTIWQDTKLDTSLFLSDSWHPTLFAHSGTLYGLAEREEADLFTHTIFSLIMIDLDTGESGVLDTRPILCAVPYREGELLLLLKGPEDALPSLEIWNKASQSLTALPRTFPEMSAYNGLAYDETNDAIYVAAPGALLRSAEGSAFEICSSLPLDFLVAGTPGHVLTGAYYALQVMDITLIPIGNDQGPRADGSLRLRGNAMINEGLNAYRAANAGIIVQHDSRPITPADAGAAIQSGDQETDIYLMELSPALHTMLQKGYAADLSVSLALKGDFEGLYPAVKAALSGADGVPRAYPIAITAYHPSLNTPLWREYMGPEAPPRTYSAFLDAMKRFISMDDDAQPDAYFVADLDAYGLLQWIITGYIRQYESDDEPLSFGRPQLRRALEQLAEIAGSQASSGFSPQQILGTEIADEDIKPELFFLQNSGLTRGFEINENGGSNLLPFIFSDDETPQFEGYLNVLLINPLSPNLPQALAFAQGMASRSGDPAAYALLHPQADEPVPNPQAQEMIAADEEELRLYTQALERAKDTGASRAEIEQLESIQSIMQQNVDNKENRRWLLSAGQIESYRAIASQIRFFETSRLLTEAAAQQIERICRRYADGQISLDLFLSELGNTAHLIHAEAQ